MTIRNEAAFQKALEHIVEFDRNGDLKAEERDYKEKLIRVLGNALSDNSLSTPGFLPRLQEAAHEVSNEIINLTHYIVFDDFKKYLKLVDPERLTGMLRNLFDETRDLAQRFDSFDIELDKDFATHIGPKRKSGWLTALLLSARNPQRYIFFRASPVNFARDAWGLESDATGSRGQRYVNFLKTMEELRVRLTPALGRPADLIDAHSFLWVEYNTAKANWKGRLAEWCKTNPKTTPPELAEIRNEFVRRFPKERFEEMTLEDYALGTPHSKESFCYWLEHRTRALGSIMGGTAHKFGVWWGEGGWRWKNRYKDENDAITRIKSGIQALIKAVEANETGKLDQIAVDDLGPFANSLRCKPLALYFPDAFLPISNPDHLRHFLNRLDAKPVDELFGMNRQLLTLTQSIPEFDGFDSQQIAQFFYDCLPPAGPAEKIIWKIAPGPKAQFWEMCRDNQCIVVHWIGDVDFRNYKDKPEIREALVQSGQKVGGASQIWWFTHDMTPGDIVVANEGMSKVVGIGKIVSAYIAPQDAGNPSADSEYRHARRVEWIISDRAEFPDNFFPPKTINKIDAAPMGCNQGSVS